MATKKDWLIVYIRAHYKFGGCGYAEHGKGKLVIWGEYKSEEIARVAVGKGNMAHLPHWYFRYCHRDVFNLMKPLWKE